MQKELSAGVIFLNKDRTKIFMGRATNVYPEKWDIPKGHVEENETVLQAAVRECLEETSHTIKSEDLKDLGHFDYSSNKDIHLFMYNGQDLPDVSQSVCTELFHTPYGSYPEFDKFAWIPLNEIIDRTGRSLGKVLGVILANDIFSYYTNHLAVHDGH